MRIGVFTIASLFLVEVIVAQSNSLSQSWNPLSGQGRYRNPIIHADYSDPDAIRAHQPWRRSVSSAACATEAGGVVMSIICLKLSDNPFIHLLVKTRRKP